MYIDPSKTILAPYSQANELVFGQNSGYLPLDDLPKTVDVCRTEVSLDLKSDYSEGILSDSVDSKSFLEIL